jgi:AraC-like DNA-binding protein
VSLVGGLERRLGDDRALLHHRGGALGGLVRKQVGNLARLAADLGFADQSHLCRVVREETGRTPSALRDVLARGA